MGKIKWMMIVILAAMILPVQSPARGEHTSAIHWSTYDEAQRNTNNTRKFFVYFYSDQCGYCKLMEEKTFKNEAVVDYINDNYTPIRINAGKEIKLATRFGIQGVPDLRFLTAKGEGIARWPGFIEGKQLITLLQYISTDSYKNMNFNDFAKNRQDR